MPIDWGAGGRICRSLAPLIFLVVALRYFLELSYAEIAHVLEIPLGTVQSRLNQALHNLRRELQAADAAGEGFGLKEGASK